MLTGGCLCGAVRYQLSEKLGPIVYCHCFQCRKASGSAFASNAPINAAEGELKSPHDNVINSVHVSANVLRDLRPPSTTRRATPG